MKYKILGVIGASLIAYVLARGLAYSAQSPRVVITSEVLVGQYLDVMAAALLGSYLYAVALRKGGRA